MRRLAIVSLLVLGALATSWIGTRALVPRLGDAMAKTMLTAAHALLPRGAAAAAATTVTDPGSTPAQADSRDDMKSGRGGRLATRSADSEPGARGHRGSPRPGRAARRQAAAGDFRDGRRRRERPPWGARLRGVGGLRVGLSDGDVVTSIDGRPTANADDATIAAMGAYASGEASAHATVQRGDRTLRVTVHIPPREALPTAAATLSR